jgi:hypothetical protein
VEPAEQGRLPRTPGQHSAVGTRDGVHLRFRVAHEGFLDPGVAPPPGQWPETLCYDRGERCIDPDFRPAQMVDASPPAVRNGVARRRTLKRQHAERGPFRSSSLDTE